MSDAAEMEQLHDLPPSCVLVFRIVEEHEPLTHKEVLSAEPYMPDRTLRYGLRRLHEDGLVDRERSLRDVRQFRYSIADA